MEKTLARIYLLAIRRLQTCCVTWHGGGRACLCFGSKEEVARRKKGGDVTGLLKLFFLVPGRHPTGGSLVLCGNTTTVVFEVHNIIHLSGNVLVKKGKLEFSSCLTC